MTEDFNLICKALQDTYDTNLLKDLLEPSITQLFQEVSKKIRDDKTKNLNTTITKKSFVF